MMIPSPYLNTFSEVLSWTEIEETYKYLKLLRDRQRYLNDKHLREPADVEIHTKCATRRYTHKELTRILRFYCLGKDYNFLVTCIDTEFTQSRKDRSVMTTKFMPLNWMYYQHRPEAVYFAKGLDILFDECEERYKDKYSSTAHPQRFEIRCHAKTALLRTFMYDPNQGSYLDKDQILYDLDTGKPTTYGNTTP